MVRYFGSTIFTDFALWCAALSSLFNSSTSACSYILSLPLNLLFFSSSSSNHKITCPIRNVWIEKACTYFCVRALLRVCRWIWMCVSAHYKLMKAHCIIYRIDTIHCRCILKLILAALQCTQTIRYAIHTIRNELDWSMKTWASLNLLPHTD